MSVPSSPSSPETPPGRPNRRWLYVGAVAAVAVVLVAVFVVPILTGSGSGTAAPVLTYSGARPIADAAVAGFQGGGWTLLFAAGLVSEKPVQGVFNSSVLNNPNCTLTPVVLTGAITVPGFTGNRSSGVSPAWEFGYRNNAGVIAIVSVIDARGQVLATLSGLLCGVFALLLSPIPGNVIDSSQAAASVAADARSFLTAHPNATGQFALLGGFNFGAGNPGPEWSVVYNTCPLSQTGTGTGDRFNATVNATSGQVVRTNTSLGVSCGSFVLLSSPLGTGVLDPPVRLAAPAMRAPLP